MQISILFLWNISGTAFFEIYKRFDFGIEQWWISIATHVCFEWHIITEYIEYYIVKYNHFVWYYHVTYGFQIESTLYRWLNVKELLVRNKHEIQIHNHLVRNRTLSHLAKLVSLAKFVIHFCVNTVLKKKIFANQIVQLNGW